MSKNYQGLESDPDEPAGGVIYEQPGSPLCPVSCFLRLIDHLNPDETALFQRPKLRLKPGNPVWFDKVPVGKHPWHDDEQDLNQGWSSRSPYLSFIESYPNHTTDGGRMAPP